MTTYVFDSMLIHERYDIVDDGGEQTWEVSFGEIYQGDLALVASENSDSFSYTSLGVTEENEMEALLTGFGMPYAIALPGGEDYIKLLDSDFSDATVSSLYWTNEGSKSAAILAITWEWEDLEEMTADSATLVIQLAGDNIPPFENYADLGSFLDGLDTVLPYAPPGYQPGDVIELHSVLDHEDIIQEDLIKGTAGNDTLIGGLGNDTISGNQGGDYITGGIGHDVLRGGEGRDDISGGKHGDLIYGGDGDDLIRGQKGNDTVYGGDGADLVNLGGGARDVFYDSPETGPAGNDTVFGGDGRDIINGRGGDDSFYGEDGNDKLRGGVGDDELYGGAGDDTLSGGSGSDTLAGGEGADVFRFRNDLSSDDNVITDYELGVDIIEMYDGYDAEDTTYTLANGTDTLITLVSGATILVEGVTDTLALRAEIEAQL
ncbi:MULTISPECIES: calcium-binding protein [Shimia]|uniref:calcium-binding protein n=1 Tax=Shimia TaxID=573139 RepID=UPI001FB33FDA|nr:MULTISPECIES: calcium-binding protein [Shimia]MDV4143391.1 calcium-binding protein [Shimia sp. FJ5]